MQTVELNNYHQGDVVAVLFPVNDFGFYTIVTGIFVYYKQDPEEGGTNRTYIHMREVRYEVKSVTGEVADERHYFDDWDGLIEENFYNDMKYFLIEPANWKVGL